jgi:hypothetical protein
MVNPGLRTICVVFSVGSIRDLLGLDLLYLNSSVGFPLVLVIGICWAETLSTTFTGHIFIRLKSLRLVAYVRPVSYFPGSRFKYLGFLAPITL